jgi:Glyoxalase-like domain
MSAFLDHVVVMVDDLVQAVADYQALGFNVTPGGTHAGGRTHNALIPFADGTYMELLAFTDRDLFVRARELRERGRLAEMLHDGTALDTRFIPLAARGPGLADAAIAVRSLPDAIGRWRAMGIAMDGPYPGGRKRPDGVDIRWELGMPQVTSLPFLIHDLTPRDLRVPAAPDAHPNGATGIHTVTYGALDPEAARGALAALWDMDGSGGARSPGPERARIEVESETVREGPMRLTLTTWSARDVVVDESRAQGVAMRLRPR